MRFIITTIMAVLMSTVLAFNPILKDPVSKTYEVDQTMTIEWIPSPSDSLVIIDVYNDRPEVLLEPYLIASGIPQRQGSYSWKIPKFLRSSVGYHIRVYEVGSAPQSEGVAGFGAGFSLVNYIASQQSTLTLLEPSGAADGSSLESTCLIGEQCVIRWEYPEWAETAVPKYIDIKLYSEGRSHPVMILAQNVPINTKSFLWKVPDHSSMKLERAYVGVMGSGKIIPGPGISCYIAASGFPFKLETRAERQSREVSVQENVDFTLISRPNLAPINGPNQTIDIPHLKVYTIPVVKDNRDKEKVKDAVSFTGEKSSQKNDSGPQLQPITIFMFAMLAIPLFY